jgi:hypothetical protein
MRGHAAQGRRGSEGDNVKDKLMRGARGSTSLFKATFSSRHTLPGLFSRLPRAGDPTQCDSARLILNMAGGGESAASVVPMRVLVVSPLQPSAIPVPGGPTLPASVTHAVAVASRAVPATTPLRAAIASCLSGGAAGLDGLQAVLHGVEADSVPGLLDAPAGEVGESLAHPDGFLYVALRARARRREGETA